MGIKRLKPRNDFIFQRLFGEQETKDSLISLLNAIMGLHGGSSIADLVIIENKQLSKELIDDKTGRLDVRAETADGVQFNIEVQLENESNMPQRTIFYNSKLLIESIKAGGRYEDIRKTVTINIVDFSLFEFDRFHSTFHFYEDHEEKMMLTDVMEIHFVEYPKFRRSAKNLENPLHRWLLFLDERLPENQLRELMEMDPVIRKAEHRLEWLSGDEETLRLYEAREHSKIELNSLLSSAEKKGKMEGRAEGEKEKLREIVLNMIHGGMQPDLIARVTGMPVEEIVRLDQNNGNSPNKPGNDN